MMLSQDLTSGELAVFKHKLLKMKAEIDAHRKVNIAELVEARLDKTLKLYVEQLEHSYSNLLQRDSIKVLKKLSREE